MWSRMASSCNNVLGPSQEGGAKRGANDTYHAGRERRRPTYGKITGGPHPPQKQTTKGVNVRGVVFEKENMGD